MIIVKLMGGLGNQMFQCAMGYALSIKQQVNLKFDTSFFDIYNQSTDSFTARSFQLTKFPNINFKKANNLDKALFFLSYDKLYKKIINKLITYTLKPLIIKEEDNSIRNLNKHSQYKYIDGYWQNETYFKEYRNEIISLFKFPTLSQQVDEIKKNIIQTNSISIHFRRQDYITNKVANEVLGVLSLEYYYNSIQYISNMINNPVFFIFSDDPEWVERNFLLTNFRKTIIYHTDNIDCLNLMSLCKHNIIANSSYSWWGAWLNTNKNKIIIAPKKWYSNNNENKELPEGWTLM